MAFGEKAHLFLGFRKKAFSISEQEYQDYYQQTGECNLLKGSDLNQQCFDKINQHSVGETLLDVGCGRGELARSLADRFQVTATDLVLEQEVVDRDATITWQQGNVEALPFKDQQFDTVVCTHVLEHVIDVQAALAELRRVASKKLIIVVPKERAYRFGFNLHVSFFPYRYSVEQVIAFGAKKNGFEISLQGGDWLYCEEI